MLFALSKVPIDLGNPESLGAIDPSAISAGTGSGAVAEFRGLVRETNDGKRVTALDYSAYEELAVTEGDSVVREALSRFAVDGAFCVHRVGSLGLGDCAIVVRVWAGHRKPAFEACSWIVDEIKTRVPIWKREYYTDQAPVWVNQQ